MHEYMIAWFSLVLAGWMMISCIVCRVDAISNGHVKSLEVRLTASVQREQLCSFDRSSTMIKRMKLFPYHEHDHEDVDINVDDDNDNDNDNDTLSFP